MARSGGEREEVLEDGQNANIGPCWLKVDENEGKLGEVDNWSGGDIGEEPREERKRGQAG